MVFTSIDRSNCFIFCCKKILLKKKIVNSDKIILNREKIIIYYSVFCRNDNLSVGGIMASRMWMSTCQFC
jgi:hypothetical protein